MQCMIAAIGKWKSGPEKDLFEHYKSRLPWKLTLKEHDVSKTLCVDVRMRKEAEWLLSASAQCEVIWALDEKGKDFSSKEFAEKLRKLRDQGVRECAFLIGGADGLHEEVKQKAKVTFSFGRVTWPHLLVRGLIAEQLYRAQTILIGHPYHRE